MEQTRSDARGRKGDDNAFCGIVNDVRRERRDRYGNRQPIESLLDGHRKHSIKRGRNACAEQASE